MFFVFHRWSAGSFAAESLGNLNMNGSNVWCMVRLYILYSDYNCIPFFLILISDTQEKVCSCHSTAPTNDCSKNVHFKLNVLEGHANFQNAIILEALEKNAAKTFN